jgi:hypothetical protein
MRTDFAALLLALATIIPAAAEDQTAPCQVVAPQKDCPADPQAQARWARKRLRELDEQAETARLNRELNRTAPPVSAPPRQAENTAPPPRQAANTAPPAQYRSALEEYQALREAYDRQLRAYYRAFPAQAAAPVSNPAPTQAELAGQDAARASPWHAYNRRDGNGY